MGSKTHDEQQRRFIVDSMPGFEALGFINHNPALAKADLNGTGVYDAAPEVVEEARGIKAALERAIGPTG